MLQPPVVHARELGSDVIQPVQFVTARSFLMARYKICRTIRGCKWVTLAISRSVIALGKTSLAARVWPRVLAVLLLYAVRSVAVRPRDSLEMPAAQLLRDHIA